MKKIVIVVVLILFLAGCWDRKELTEIGMVAALAIDQNPKTGEYEVSSQFLRPAAESTQTPSPERPFLMVTTSGKTIFEAMRGTNKTTDRKGFFAHNKVIIINERVAKEGLIPVLDALQRGKEIRGYVWLCIAKDVDASKILEMKSDNIARIPAKYINSLIDNAEQEAAKINILTFQKKMLASGIDPVAGVFITEKTVTEPFERIKLIGGAVFQKDKLKGFLNDKETRGYHWVTEEKAAQLGAVSLPSLLEEGKFVTVEVRKVRSQIKPEVKGENQFSFTIEVKEDGRITDQQASEKFEDRKQQVDYFRKIEAENKKLIEEEIDLAVKKAQQYKTDIFGFGQALNKENPEVWNKVKDNWEEIFADVSYEVNANVDITSSVLLQGPLQPE
ncbi:Ger(x)C family spore germination protein [Alkalihalobacillus sp. BA299]|uniref:Ger(x)C family spore germination protein n=1 Tax=Alkalihalobacillus sp. BA299 TaxID=2815938 RepID=UPI001ADB2DB4|nr:Ger(x)C family spore germination protein [Alkalihalobacillus sp. BA299]